MKLAQRLERYCRRQREVRSFTYDKTQLHHCPCCGEDYAGNYCPACGLPTGKGPITWHSIQEGVMDLWGLGSRSLPRTLWQLIVRPGHLIASYISGRRQVSFPPVKMLVIMALVALLVNNVCDSLTPATSSGVDTAPSSDNSVLLTADHYFDVVYDWMSIHFDWACMLLFSFFIFPTLITFRYAPRCGHHNVPQGFFIQVFNSMQLLLIVMVVFISDVILYYTFPTVSDEVQGILVTSLLAVMLYRTYKQLFGYGAWGTVWRLLTMLVSGCFLFGATLCIFYVVMAMGMGEWAFVKRIIMTRVLLFLAVAALPLVLTHLINKHQARRDYQCRNN